MHYTASHKLSPTPTITVVAIVALTRYETAMLGGPAKPVSYPAHIAGAVAGEDVKDVKGNW